MIKAGRLDRKYNGIVDCFKRTMADEGKIWYSRVHLLHNF